MEEKAWVKEYTEELDSNKRKEILAAAIEEEGLTPENELRKAILETRYTETKGQKIDTFIRGWMELQFLSTSRRMLFGGRGMKKEKNRVREDLQLALAEEHGETGRQVLYEEFCHTARLFNHLCREDRGYTSVLFGLGRMKDSSVTKKIANSFYTVAYDVPARIGMEEELKDFSRALADVFSALYPDEKDLLAGEAQ